MERCRWIVLVVIAACSGSKPQTVSTETPAPPAPAPTTNTPPTTPAPTAPSTSTPAGPPTDAELDAMNQRVVDVLARMGRDVEGRSCADAAAALEAAVPEYAAAEAAIAALSGADHDRFRQRFFAGGYDDKMDAASSGTWAAARRCHGDAAMAAAMKHLGEAESGAGGGQSERK